MTGVILVFIMCCILTARSSSCYRSATYTVTNGKYFDTSAASEIFTTHNVKECSILCFHSYNCVAVNYQSGTGDGDICQMLTESARTENDLTDHADRKYLLMDHSAGQQ